MLPITITLRRLSAVRITSLSPRFGLLPRTVHGSQTVQRQRDPPNPVSHGTENYFVDSDDTPPPNNPIYKVDAASDAVESAYEPPTGPWSRAGAGTEEYRTASKDEPYDVPDGSDAKLRYGGTKRQGPETSKPWEGPTGTERRGRKPEGRA